MSAREPGTHVEFVMHPLLHGLDSKSAGREVYVDKPHVRIRVAGYDKDEFFGPVTDQMKARFPEEWEQFQKGAVVERIGTPLHAWGRITPALAKNLEAFNCFTVEDIIGLSEVSLQKIGMGARKLQEDAQKFLSMSQTSADLSRMEDLQTKNAEMAAEMAELKAQMAELTKPKGKPGRKPKNEAQAE